MLYSLKGKGERTLIRKKGKEVDEGKEKSQEMGGGGEERMVEGFHHI